MGRWDDELGFIKSAAAKCNLLSAEEECELAARIANGDNAALQKLVQCNLRLVLHALKDYIGFARQFSGITAGDLMQEGNIGLMYAAKGFDGTRGVRFATYATPHIRQHISRAVRNRGHNIHLPGRIVDLIIKYRRVIDELTKSNKKAPTNSEIAEFMELPVKTVNWLEQHSYNCGLLDSNTPRSRHDDADVDFIQTVADNKYGSLEEETEKKILRENLMSAVREVLTPAERRIIYERIGYNKECTAKSLAKVGKSIGISHESVRVKERKILKKLRCLDFAKLGFHDLVADKAK